jgi:hypothetical protein
MGGYWLIGRYQQFLVKQEMKEQIKSNLHAELVTHFTFKLANGTPDDPSFTWLDDHEFQYKGNLYDVIEQQEINGQLYIRCLNDTKEKELLNALLEKARKQNDSSSAGEKNQPTLLTLVFIAPVTPLLSIPVYSIKSANPYYSASLLNPAKKIFTPPPRV